MSQNIKRFLLEPTSGTQNGAGTGHKVVTLAYADVLGLDFYQETPLYTCFTQRFVLGRKAGRGRDRGGRIGLLSGQPSTHNYLKKTVIILREPSGL